MEEFASSVQLPWVVFGDFNDVLNSSEKFGGNLPAIGRCKAFNNMLTSCGLIDLAFKGPSFTWCNKRQGVRKIEERLDRVVSNADWRLLFPEAEVRHLPRLHSDHCPVILYCEPNIHLSSANRPLRFQAMWLTATDFHAMIRQSWSHLHGYFDQKLDKMAELLKYWNKETFGNLFERKKELRARIGGVQRSLANSRSHQLEFLEVFLISEYNHLLKQEEIFWAQKSRVQWIQHGERKTPFFHLSTICRCRRNRITMLRDDSGEWVSDPSQVRNLVTDFFKNLYSLDNYQRNPLVTSCFPSLTDDDRSLLSKEIALHEVHMALFQMKAWKAPGVDGFQACFSQECWDTVGDSLIDLVQQAFASGTFNPQLNRTLLVLIPKVTNPEYSKQFLPISLCTVAYKLITKVLVNRLRPFLDKLVTPFQSSFIPKRQSADNILIAQEMIQKLGVNMD